jgi:hypothetical protein
MKPSSSYLLTVFAAILLYSVFEVANAQEPGPNRGVQYQPVAPVLTSDIPENRELVDGVGFTFKTGDAADLERMLRLLIADTHVRKAAGRRAKRRIQEQYLWSEVAREVERVYLEMVGWKRDLPLDSKEPPTRSTRDRAA